MAGKSKDQKETSSRFTAHEIFEAALQHSREELRRPSTALGFSGVAGGLTLGLTGLSVGIVLSLLGNGPVAQVIAAAVYPIGFVAVIIGRAQLFTENTLYPVVLVIDERKHVQQTLRLWTVVFIRNLLGSLCLALLMTKTTAFRPEVQQTLITLGQEAVHHPFNTVFWS